MSIFMTREEQSRTLLYRNEIHLLKKMCLISNRKVGYFKGYFFSVQDHCESPFKESPNKFQTFPVSPEFGIICCYLFTLSNPVPEWLIVISETLLTRLKMYLCKSTESSQGRVFLPATACFYLVSPHINININMNIKAYQNQCDGKQAISVENCI